MSKSVVVATHGHCFDGLCSAVLFTRLYEHVVGKGTFKYLSQGYGPGQNGVDPKVFDGDDNAILDYRFTASHKLTWYFDHHVSAFPTDAERAAYEAGAESAQRQMFHDGTYGSCTKLIRDVGKERFGLAVPELEELVRWADIIDAARFSSAEAAVDRKEPVLRLMTVVENYGDSDFVSRLVPKLLGESLEDVASSKEVDDAYGPLGRAHDTFIAIVRENAKEAGGVVLVDLSAKELEAAAKFVTYALYPKSRYSVLLTRSKSKVKLSLGFNPWAGQARTHDIAKICERYGGGGHPVVGAAAFPLAELDRAKKAAEDVAAELARD